MNPLKLARLCVRPRLSHARAAQALGVGATTMYRQECDGFDPATLSIKDLEARAALYGCTVPQLLGREPLPTAVAS